MQDPSAISRSFLCPTWTDTAPVISSAVSSQIRIFFPMVCSLDLHSCFPCHHHHRNPALHVLQKCVDYSDDHCPDTCKLFCVKFISPIFPDVPCVMIAIDLTIVTQFTTKSFVIGMLFGAEVALLAATAFISHRFAKSRKLWRMPRKSRKLLKRKRKNENSYT